MEKPAQTDYPIEEILKRRWSPRAFSDRMVESEKLLSLFEAARWAPSSFNEQPWFFIVATKQKLEEHARLLSCFVEKNQQWARLAPVLMVSVAKLKFEKTGKPNRHAFHDVGLAMGNMLVCYPKASENRNSAREPENRSAVLCFTRNGEKFHRWFRDERAHAGAHASCVRSAGISAGELRSG